MDIFKYQGEIVMAILAFLVLLSASGFGVACAVGLWAMAAAHLFFWVFFLILWRQALLVWTWERGGCVDDENPL